MCKWVKIILLINSTLIFVLFLKQWQDETVCYGNHVKSSQCAPTVRSFATTQSKVKLSVRDLGCATYQTTASPAWLAKNRPLFVKYRPEIGILLPKLFWPTVRKNCFSDRENFAKNLRSLEQFIPRSEQILVTECFFSLFLEIS